MYKNLDEILKKKNVTKKALASILGIAEKTLSNKLNGVTDFTLTEVLKISSAICPEYRIEFVFKKDEAYAEKDVA